MICSSVETEKPRAHLEPLKPESVLRVWLGVLDYILTNEKTNQRVIIRLPPQPNQPSSQILGLTPSLSSQSSWTLRIHTSWRSTDSLQNRVFDFCTFVLGRGLCLAWEGLRDYPRPWAVRTPSRARRNRNRTKRLGISWTPGSLRSSATAGTSSSRTSLAPVSTCSPGGDPYTLLWLVCLCIAWRGACLLALYFKKNLKQSWLPRSEKKILNTQEIKRMLFNRTKTYTHKHTHAQPNAHTQTHTYIHTEAFSFSISLQSTCRFFFVI